MNKQIKIGMVLLAFLMAWVLSAGAENQPSVTIISADGQVKQAAPSSLDSLEETEDVGQATNAATAAQPDPAVRQAFIDQILALAQETFDKTGGKPQRAHYSGDIYVCKNFTVYLFRETCDGFRMAQFPDVPLVIPDNQVKADCAPYVYGVEWKDVPASQGNPFEAAATFRYDPDLSKADNIEAARAFLRQVKRGDYFQMAAKYYYGTGAHSMIFCQDYDPATDSVHWTDSNMKGEKRNGERYGVVQWDAVKEIDWFVDAFCRKGYGATIYRLREDIIPAF